MSDHKQPASAASGAANVAIAFIVMTVAMWVAERSTPIGGVQGNPEWNGLVNNRE